MSEPQIIGGKYQVVRPIGGGGMGQVYEARHTGTGRRVAVKVIHEEALAKNKDAMVRFQREARAAGAIETQHIAQVFDTGSDPETGRPFMVMELLQGEDLAQAIARLGPLPPELALRIVAQACVGLERAHATGVVHRDIKPANLFLSQQEGGDIIVKILDFGIAKVRVDLLSKLEDGALTRTGSMLGSPVYMSPEQVKGEKDTDHRTDVWSMGVVLYEALTGVTPHGHSETFGRLIFAICSEAPRRVQQRAPWVSSEVAAIVHKALKIDVGVRYPSAAEMLAAIRALLPGGTSLEATMFVPISPSAKSVSPELLANTDPALPVPDRASGGFGSISGGGAEAAAREGLERSRPGAPRSRIATLFTLGGLFAVAGAALGYQLVTHEAAPLTSIPAEPASTSTSPPNAAPPATPPPVQAATTATAGVDAASEATATQSPVAPRAPDRRPPSPRPAASASATPASSAKRVDPGSYL